MFNIQKLYIIKHDVKIIFETNIHIIFFTIIQVNNIL